MNIEDFKIMRKSKYDFEVDKIQSDIFKAIGFEKYYVLGEIAILKSIIDVIGKDKICKDDLIEFLKTFTKTYHWTQDIVDAI
jgi:histidyl-tRNA synthetase